MWLEKNLKIEKWKKKRTENQEKIYCNAEIGEVIFIFLVFRTYRKPLWILHTPSIFDKNTPWIRMNAILFKWKLL